MSHDMMCGLMPMFWLAMVAVAADTNATTGDASGSGGEASLASLFGGLSLTDVALLSAILALILLLLAIMWLQRHRAQAHIESQLRQRHAYAQQSLRAQTIPHSNDSLALELPLR